MEQLSSSNQSKDTEVLYDQWQEHEDAVRIAQDVYHSPESDEKSARQDLTRAEDDLSRLATDTPGMPAVYELHRQRRG